MQLPRKVLSVMISALLCLSSMFAEPVDGVHARIELVAEGEAIVPGEVFEVAVHFEIDPHWHIYWQNPGASGLPPEITWGLPDGFEAGEIEWPAPKQIELGGLVNYGYEDEATFIVPIRAPASLELGTSVEIVADLFYLICEEACLPGEAQLQLTLPVAAESSLGGKAALFEAARGAQSLSAIRLVS
ncbi:MAG: protein-disulfide reductase DsbD domain-containing protein, partial [Verrucomicrobiota bacterium]